MAQRVRPKNEPIETVTPGPGGPTIGHNQPPPETRMLTVDEVRENLDRSSGALIARRLEIMRGFIRMRTTYPEITTVDVQAKVGDFRKAIAGFEKLCKTRHTQDKEPFLEGGRVVDAFYRNLQTGLVEEVDGTPLRMSVASIDNYLRDQQNAFAQRLRAQQEREARERAEKAAEEARQKAAGAAANPTSAAIDEAVATARVAERTERQADAKPAEHSRVVGEHSTTSLRTVWTFEIIDRAALLSAAAGMPLPSQMRGMQMNLSSIIERMEAAKVSADIVTDLKTIRDWFMTFPKTDTPFTVYGEPDAKRIRHAVVSDGVRDIPGCRIFQDSYVP